jgi:hypothetical protein
MEEERRSISVFFDNGRGGGWLYMQAICETGDESDGFSMTNLVEANFLGVYFSVFLNCLHIIKYIIKI